VNQLIKSQLLYQLSYRGNCLTTNCLRVLRFCHCIRHYLTCTKDNKSNTRADEMMPRKHAAKDASLSPDGKWKSFPKVPNLLQYVRTGTFYGRTKVNGKVVRKTLETAIFTTAQQKVRNFLSDQGKARAQDGMVLDTFMDARLRYEERLRNTIDLASATLRYRTYCIKALLKSWPELDGVKPAKITNRDCMAWAKTVSYSRPGASRAASRFRPLPDGLATGMAAPWR
jgi:hypothetical protein